MSYNARITPGRFESALGLLVGIVFIAIGGSGGGGDGMSFGTLLMLAGLGAVLFNGYNLFSEHGIAERVVHFDDSDLDRGPERPAPSDPASRGHPVERLQRLETLRERGLISEQEYQAQRKRVLADL